jgi:hypothetical protein
MLMRVSGFIHKCKLDGRSSSDTNVNVYRNIVNAYIYCQFKESMKRIFIGP